MSGLAGLAAAFLTYHLTDGRRGRWAWTIGVGIVVALVVYELTYEG